MEGERKAEGRSEVRMDLPGQGMSGHSGRGNVLVLGGSERREGVETTTG